MTAWISTWLFKHFLWQLGSLSILLKNFMQLGSLLDSSNDYYYTLDLFRTLEIIFCGIFEPWSNLNWTLQIIVMTAWISSRTLSINYYGSLDLFWTLQTIVMTTISSGTPGLIATRISSARTLRSNNCYVMHAAWISSTTLEIIFIAAWTSSVWTFQTDNLHLLLLDSSNNRYDNLDLKWYWNNLHGSLDLFWTLQTDSLELY
jgi:hypothetical protein